MAAHTRMPGSASTAQKEAFVTDLINRLGLTKSADSVVGGAKKRGLSGGEKKRLSIGAELIAEPMLLFTDEPTTGLDSFQAEKVPCIPTSALSACAGMPSFSLLELTLLACDSLHAVVTVGTYSGCCSVTCLKVRGPQHQCCI